MRDRLGLLLSLTLLPLVVCSAAADTNPYANSGFESGLSGWTTALDSGSASIVSVWNGSTITFLPQSGSRFLSLMGGNGDIPQVVYRDVLLQAGDTLSGWAAWDPHEDPEDNFNDSAGVSIYDSQLNLLATPWYYDVNTSGALTSINWSPWSWVAPGAGTYRLAYSSTNWSDGSFDSYALFDAGPPLNGPDPAIPEPGTLALLLIGAGPLGVWLRKRRNSE